MTAPTVEDALRLYDRGLAVVPAPADDGKSVEGVVANYNKWRARLPRWKTEELFRKHPGANVAILPHLCRPRLVIVDCDDTAAFAVAEREYGPTPLVVRSPRGTGWHRYYRAPDGPVRQRSLRRSHGFAIEIKGGPGAVVVVPPSVRPSTGRPYAFDRGDWGSLANLPVYRPAFEARRAARPGAEVGEGGRNDHLFRELLKHAGVYGCDGLGGMRDVAHLINERDCHPTLSWDEVEDTAGSAWKYHASGKNWVRRKRFLEITEAEFRLLVDVPMALALWVHLRFSHQGLNDTFAVSAKAMAAAGVMPGWSVQAYRKARDVLLGRGFLTMVHKGGRCPGDPDLFTLCAGVGGMGADSAPNTNRTPSPPAFSAPEEAVPRVRPRRKAA